jgi:two-component system cell cycle response regulator
MTDRRGRILVVDDDAFSRTLYGDMLAEAGHEVVLSAGGAQALERLRSESFDAVISDLVMPDVPGFQVLEEAQSLPKPVDVVIVTGHATVRNAVLALKSGAFDYITKPVDPEELKLSIQRLLSQRALLDENRDLKGYVGLFRRCQTLTGCLDREQIARMAVESLVEEMGGISGVFLAPPTGQPKKDGSPRPAEERAGRGMQGKVSRALATVLGGDPLAFPAVQTLDAKAGAEVATQAKLDSPLGPCMVIPARVGNANFGALFIGRTPGSAPFGLSDLGKADFFGKQVALALDNASKFSEAKELAYVDDLTELYNVRYLNYILEKEISRM